MGNEYWLARELMLTLEYSKWGNFKKVIMKSKLSCELSENVVSDHFADIGKMVEAGVSSKSIDDFILSRYVCYLIVQNADQC